MTRLSSVLHGVLDIPRLGTRDAWISCEIHSCYQCGTSGKPHFGTKHIPAEANELAKTGKLVQYGRPLGT